MVPEIGLIKTEERKNFLLFRYNEPSEAAMRSSLERQ